MSDDNLYIMERPTDIVEITYECEKVDDPSDPNYN